LPFEKLKTLNFSFLFIFPANQTATVPYSKIKKKRLNQPRQEKKLNTYHHPLSIGQSLRQTVHGENNAIIF
jgi:hypothetical protein